MELKIMRIKLGMTQMDLAIATGIPKWRIQMHEQGYRLLEEHDRKKIKYLAETHENQGEQK